MGRTRVEHQENKLHSGAEGSSASLLAACLLLALFFLAGSAGQAFAVNASMQLEYGISSQSATDASGSVTDTDSIFFEQRYSLSFQRQIYPHLSIYSNTTFEKDLSTGRVQGGESITSTTTSLRPNIGASLAALPFTAGIDYSENRLTTGSSGSPSYTIIQDSYNAVFTWSPNALPPLQLSYSKFHTYDAAHLQTDEVNDSFNYSTNYMMLPGMTVGYSGSYGVFTDRLNQVTSKTLVNGILGRYSATMGNETSFSASYGATSQQTTTDTSVESGGEVYFRVIPFDTFSRGPDIIPAAALQFQRYPNDATYENRALMDGDTKSVASGNSGSVNIGTAGNPNPNFPQLFHMGMEIQNSQSVNALYIYVSQDISSIQNFDPYMKFSWSVYTSNDDQNWTPVVMSAHASFRTIDPLGLPASGFEIDLPADINQAWVQVVVSPLSPFDINTLPPDQQKQLANIFVTEFRSFEKKPAQQVQSYTQSSALQSMSVGFSTLVLDNPHLAFTINYVANSQGQSSFNYLASGGLTMQQSFVISRTLTGTASFFTEDARNQKGTGGVALVYTTGLTWTPLPTLKSSVVYTGDTAFQAGRTVQTNSIFLDSTAQLYSGLNVYLNGGGTLPGGGSTSYLYSAGASVIPYRTVSLGLNYSASVQTGSGGQESSYNKTANATVTYSPFSNLFVSASTGWLSTPQFSSSTESYNAGWSPLQGGMLQLNLGYNEGLGFGASTDKVRTITFGVNLRVAPTASLDASYSIQKTQSIGLAQTDTDTIFLEFRKYM